MDSDIGCNVTVGYSDISQTASRNATTFTTTCDFSVFKAQVLYLYRFLFLVAFNGTEDTLICVGITIPVPIDADTFDGLAFAVKVTFKEFAISSDGCVVAPSFTNT